jgi:two-component system CheB/CheR fusion protein
MTEPGRPGLEERVLLLGPTARDAATGRDVLAAAGVRCFVCGSLPEVCREMERGAGATVVPAEAALGDREGCLPAVLRAQPPWSDPPLIVLTPAGAESPAALRTLAAVGHMTLVQRPVQVSTLVSAVQAALRDRWRQYEVRDLLAARERQAEALRRDALLLAGVRDSVIVTDLEGVITYWNEGATRLFGWTAQEMLGRPLTDRVPEAARPPMAALTQAIAAGEEFAGEWPDYRKDGSRLWIDARVSRFSDAEGRPVGILGLAHDITARKLAEEALKEADRRKDEFLAMLGHELRNPLAPIRTTLEVLRLGRPDGERLEKSLATMDRQVTHLTRLVDDLLDVSRITRGLVELQRAPVELAAVVGQAVEMARVAVASRGHELLVTLPARAVRLEADATRLTQVLFNLLNNAAKYTEPGGRIWLTAAPDGAAVELRVRDTGVGIGPELLPRVFDLFTQGERTLDRSQGGLGLGLTLVKRLVEMHGGTVEARSAGPGQGSEFVVRLPAPAAAPAGQPPAPAAAPVPAARPGRVLVVDDNVDVAESVALLLQEGLGHEVRVAHSGPQALELAREFRPEAVICDIGLPGMDGYEVARRLRRLPEGDSALLVALSGYGQEEDRQRSREAGFDVHLLKPVGWATLQPVLTQLGTVRP